MNLPFLSATADSSQFPNRMLFKKSIYINFTAKSTHSLYITFLHVNNRSQLAAHLVLSWRTRYDVLLLVINAPVLMHYECTLRNPGIDNTWGILIYL